MKKIILPALLFFIGIKNLIQVYILGKTVYIFPHLVLGLALILSAILYFKNDKVILPGLTLLTAYAVYFFSESSILFHLSFSPYAWYTAYHEYGHVLEAFISLFMGTLLLTVVYKINKKDIIKIKVFVSLLLLYAIGIFIEVIIASFEYTNRPYIYEGTEVYASDMLPILIGASFAVLLIFFAFTLTKEKFAQYSGLALALILLTYGVGQAYPCSHCLRYDFIFYRYISVIVAVLTVPVAYMASSRNVKEALNDLFKKKRPSGRVPTKS
ncbi:MAG: hypothetical protein U9N35_05975 [Euryarchaeota archaeon]|nr:hypothetical protein [Euryarchaeota archaeon]